MLWTLINAKLLLVAWIKISKRGWERFMCEKLEMASSLNRSSEAKWTHGYNSVESSYIWHVTTTQPLAFNPRQAEALRYSQYAQIIPPTN